MAFAELWLPIFGAGIFLAWAIGAWYGEGNNKILATWLIFFGVVCLFLLATLEWQHHIRAFDPKKTTPANIEAPSVGIKVIDPGIKSQVGRAYERGRLKYCFVNHGRTVANVTAYTQRIAVMRPGTGAPDGDLTKEMTSIPSGLVVPPFGGESEMITLNCHTEILHEDQVLLDNFRNKPFLMIAVQYRDEFDGDAAHEYVRAFCYMFDSNNDRWVLSSYDPPKNVFRKTPLNRNA